MCANVFIFHFKEIKLQNFARTIFVWYFISLGSYKLNLQNVHKFQTLIVIDAHKNNTQFSHSMPKYLKNIGVAVIIAHGI